ncbi:hypothetical protein C2G38_2204240 [Gigaspora rosea]|uniref:Uncharacterized protein n=1 Tax=Gigaspora rosea TaxID=44941 RepID=A0A397ULL5_9GLOM|nr:hypothetical protein C2G38_2204240 [Gigaspora rosea]
MNPEIHEQKKFLRNITKDYIDLQDSNQENNVVEQILSKEELNIKLQGLLDQIKIQIQTLQGQLTLEEAYKNNEYTFLFKRATAIYKTINSNKSEVIVQRKYLSQIRKLVEFYIEESNLTEYWRTQEPQLSETEKAYLNRTLLALEGARNIQENDQATQIIFPNTGLTQATQDYLLQHHTQLILETSTTRRNPRTNNLEIIGTPIITEAIGILLQTAFGQYTKIILLLENYKSEIIKELTTLETPRLKEYYKTALISISVNQGILEEKIKEISIQNIEGEINNLMNEEQNKTLEELRKFRFNWKPISRPPKNRKAKRYPRNKDILESRELIQITDDIWNTINDLIDRINPTNNSRLGAILLTLEGAKSIAREFYPHTLEYDKQRPDRIPPHILTRTATLFPDLTGRELVKEQKKQRNIYNNFLDNTQAQIEGIKKRLLAESPEFCKIFEENPETEETEFYYGDYNNQFTILPFRFHHLILHHLEAIDNILYSEGARNKIYFEEEEKEIIIEELKEEYFKRTGRKIEEYGYCTIASDIKEIEPEYLEHEELYKKLDYLHSIIINNIGQYLIKRKETYDTVGELNIYNCYSDNRTWNKLTIARNIFKLQEQVYQPYLGHEIGIVAANKSYADIIENIILSIKGDQFHQKIESTIEKAYNYRPQYFSHLAITRRIKLKLKYIRPEYLFEQYHSFLVKPEDLGETNYIKKNKRKEPIEALYKNLEKLKSDLKAELFELALRYESKNNETLSIHNCYENKEYWEIVDTIRRINLTIEYQEQTYSPYYQAQPEKEKQERLQSSYIKFLEELYEKQVGIWIANQYVIVETYEELEKYHEQYWERESISVLEQPLQ